MDAKGNSIDFIRDMSIKAVIAANASSVATYECDIRLAYHKLYVSGAYLDAAQDALRQSRSDSGRWEVDSARRLLEEAIADYADAVGHSMPPIECFMESR